MVFQKLLLKNLKHKIKNNISVIIPCYNYGRYLSEAIQSVLNQTKKPLEIIIADDCSSDNSGKVAKKYVKKYPKLIKYFKNSKNLGIVKNFNKSVLLTKGGYVCLLGADNRFNKNYLKETSFVLDSIKKIGIVYTDFVLFGPRSEKISLNFKKNFICEKSNNGTFIVRFPDFTKKTRILQKSLNFIHGSSLYRKSAYLKVGGYVNLKGTPEDQNLFSRILDEGWDAKRIAEPLLEYRQHSINQANIKLQRQQLKEHYESKHINLQELYDNSEELKKIKDSKLYTLWIFYNKIKKNFIKIDN